MKKFVYSIVAIAAVMISFSCVKSEVIEKEDIGVIVTKPLTVTCTLAEPTTKVDINGSTGKTEWKAGDEVLFHGKWAGKSGDKYYSRTVELQAGDISADKKSFTVTIDEIVSIDDATWKSNSRGANLYMAYPASAVQVNDGAASWYAKTYWTTSNLPLVCGFNDIDDPTHFTVFNLCSIIAFKTSGDFDGYVFKGRNKEVVGYDGYYSEVTIRQDKSFKDDGWAMGSGLTEILGSVVNDGATENLICIPSGANFTNGFEIILTKGGVRSKVAIAPNPIDLSRAGSSGAYKCKYLSIGSVDGHLTDYVPDTPPATDHYNTSAIPVGTASALDASESANSYIVKAAGSYKFKAVKGNNTSKELITINSVEILWETQNSSADIEPNSVIKAVDYEYQSGNTPYIVFETPTSKQAGNALIAAKDDHGDIIWSWHIWIPSTSVEDVDTGFAGAQKIMDRNLGALIVTPAEGALESQGLYYQWGRKDPLCGTKITGVPSSAMKEYVSGKAKDIETSIKHPTTFYYVEGSDWLASEGSATLWNFAGKTMYDPCPPGYRVPDYDASKNMWNKADANFGAEGNWTYVENKYCTFNDAESMFSLCGYLNGTGQSESGYGKRSLVWSSTHYNANNASCMLIRENQYKSAYQSKSSGGNVRCILDVAPAPVSITIDGNLSEWENVSGATTGSHTFKITSDENYIYFYNYRSKDSRWKDLWGGAGYIYVGFDLDGNDETGETLNGKGPYEFVFFVTPYGGTAAEPAIAADFTELGYGAACLPSTSSVTNVFGKGVVTDDGVGIEYRLPRADIPAIPTNAIKIISEGNKDLSRVTVAAKL